MKKLSVALFLLLLGSMAPTLALNPGVVFEVETTYHSGSSPRVETAEMSVEGEMLKMEILPGETGGSGGPKDEAIFRGDRGQMVVVHHRDQSYMVIDEAAVRGIAGQFGAQAGAASGAAAGGQIAAGLAELQKRLEGLDPESRRKMEEMLRGQGLGGLAGAAGGAAPGRSTTEYRNTGDRGTQAGYPCVRYEVLRGGRKVRELWVTDWSNVDGGDEARDALAGVDAFVAGLLQQLPGGAAGAGLFGDFENPADPFNKTGSFPVVTREFEDDGDLESESILRSTRRMRLDPDAFEPPSGYKRMSMGPQ